MSGPTAGQPEESTAGIARVVVLGTDALLSALPATPVQVVHACLAAGFDAAVPASWGDELVAAACLRELATREAGPAIQCSCPCVARRLTSGGSELERFMLTLDPPPVAAARYVRALYGSSPVAITYAGACPGGADAVIDRALDPPAFLALLAERGVSLGDQPAVFDSVLPPDRRRHRSLPGGVPSPEALQEEGAAHRLIEIAAETFATELAEHLLEGESVLLDLAPRMGCVCSGSVPNVGASRARAVVTSLEPPRSPLPVVDLGVGVRLQATPRDLAAVVTQGPPCTPEALTQTGWRRTPHAQPAVAGAEGTERRAPAARQAAAPPEREPEREPECERGDSPEVAPAEPHRPARGASSRPEPMRPEPMRPPPRSGGQRPLPRTYALTRATSGRYRAVTDTAERDAERVAERDAERDAVPHAAAERARGEHGLAVATPADAGEIPPAPAPAHEEPLPRLTPLLGRTIDTPPRSPEVPDTARQAEAAGPEEFEAFLDDVRAAVADTVAEWRAQLREAIARWRAQGFVTTILERALRLPKAPDVEGLIGTYEAATAHLARLEARAVALAPELRERLTGHPVFRDPSRVADAELIVERLTRRGTPGGTTTVGAMPPGAGSPPLDPPESVPALVYEWSVFEEDVIEEIGDGPGPGPGYGGHQ